MNENIKKVEEFPNRSDFGLIIKSIASETIRNNRNSTAKLHTKNLKY